MCRLRQSANPDPSACPQRRHALAVLAAFVLAASLGAARPDTLSLFDGKTLDGWKPADYAGAGELRVEDGTLVMPAGNPMTGVVCTREDLPLTDYELTYEAMRISGSDFFAAATIPVGKSHATFVNGGWGGSITGLSSLNGADASENQTGRFFKYEDKTWYTFRIRVTAATIRCAIDGKEVVTLDHRGLQVATRIESRACRPLGFATYRTAGALRKVVVRKLTAEEVAATDKVE